MYNDNNTAATCNKQTNNETVKPNIIYCNAANNDAVFNPNTPNVSHEVAASATNNNVDSGNFRSPRKRKPKSAPKQKKTKLQETLQDNFAVFQLPSGIQSSDSIVASIPVGINKILTGKSEKADGVTVAVADEQYQIFLLEA